MRNGSTDWRLQNFSDIFRVTLAGSGVAELELDGSGNLTIGGQITTTGSCSVGCDRVFDADYKIPTIGQHASQMWKNKHLPAVGPTPENGQINLSQKVGAMLNELEKAHIYIDQLHGRIEKLEKLAKKTDQ